MARKLSLISEVAPQFIATATLRVETPGTGFTEITSEARDFVAQAGASEGVLLVYLRHTSASLTIQENADPDVQTDLITALDRLAPEHAPWVHDVEGPDDMPAHVKAMLNGAAQPRGDIPVYRHEEIALSAPHLCGVERYGIG
jgi:secondary thiamine-phosphate synthase enzyme